MSGAETGRRGTQRSEATYTFFSTTFVVVLVLTNIIGTKLFVLFPNGGPDWLLDGGSWTLTSGIITYPFTFFLTDHRLGDLGAPASQLDGSVGIRVEPF